MRRLALGVVVAAVVGLLPVAGYAEGVDPGRGNAEVGPTSTANQVAQGAASYDPSGIQASASSQPIPTGGNAPEWTGPQLTYRAVPYNAIPTTGPIYVNNQGVISQPTGPGQAACPPNQTGYYVYDSQGNSLGMICVPNPSDNLPPPTTPEIALAEQASSQQPWPTLTMGINPGVGLTGMPSWFWLSGGSTTMPNATATAGPLTVSVRAAFAGVTWEFGDGTGYDSTDAGQAYPAKSDVAHVYQSDTYGRQTGYTVTGVLRYVVSYSVNGGPWTKLGVKTKAFNQQYFVYQLQPEAVAA